MPWRIGGGCGWDEVAGDVFLLYADFMQETRFNQHETPWLSQFYPTGAIGTIFGIYCAGELYEGEQVTFRISQYQRQPYLSEKKVVEARTMFRINSGLFPCKVNYQSDPKYSKDLWFCDSCERQIDSMSHVTICPAYKSLREGKNIESDKDLVE